MNLHGSSPGMSHSWKRYERHSTIIVSNVRHSLVYYEIVLPVYPLSYLVKNYREIWNTLTPQKILIQLKPNQNLHSTTF